MKESVKLPDLPYDFNALEPVLSAEIMQLHYGKHHATYVNNLNAALDKRAEAEAKGDVAGMIAQDYVIKFNGGGHVNHTIFWTNLAPVSAGGGELPRGELLEAINKRFSSIENFIEKMNLQAAAVQGSGWAWLGYCKKMQTLELASCPNQDPLVLTGLVPLLGIDVWEHAYYLQYKNVRAEYLKNIWKVVNWKNVEQRFESLFQI